MNDEQLEELCAAFVFALSDGTKTWETTKKDPKEYYRKQLRALITVVSKAGVTHLLPSNVSVNGRAVPWGEIVSNLDQEIRSLRPAQKMLSDLDRNEHGRHEGDSDVGSVGGVSRGNPLLKTGDTVGYDISGRPYTMPPRGKRHDPLNWLPKKEDES